MNLAINNQKVNLDMFLLFTIATNHKIVVSVGKDVQNIRA